MEHNMDNSSEASNHTTTVGSGERDAGGGSVSSSEAPPPADPSESVSPGGAAADSAKPTFGQEGTPSTNPAAAAAASPAATAGSPESGPSETMEGEGNDESSDGGGRTVTGEPTSETEPDTALPTSETEPDTALPTSETKPDTTLQTSETKPNTSTSETEPDTTLQTSETEPDTPLEDEEEEDDDDSNIFGSSCEDDDSEMEADNSQQLAEALEDMKKKADDIMKKPKPKHTWSLVKELHKRQLGDRPSLLQQDRFRINMYSSLHAVERLELMDKLCFHEGCVNCLNFNSSGDLLVSGSDDLNVVVWDWQRQRKAYYYNSGHKSNIFEVKFLPLRADTHIVSTSRDGQVRLAEISPAGECRSVRRLAQHRGSGRKLALPAHSPHTVLSCGEDAVVFSIDVRERQPDRLATCMDNGKPVSTNSIAAHPEDDNVFLLSCVDKYVRVYDRRMIDSGQQAYRRLCPHRLLEEGGRNHYSVTCAVFNYSGSEIVASYSDDDIYLFDASHSDGADAVRQYSGHRNSATIKGVNFYGPTSEYVVSGSDCGNIFFWDKQTEAIVQCMPGDEKGVVNCLEPHPHMPVLATSGLDDDVKLWIASKDQPADLSSLHETVERNLQERVEETPSADTLGGGLMWTLMQQVFGTHRRRHQLFSLSDELEVMRSSDDSGEEDGPGDCRPT